MSKVKQRRARVLLVDIETSPILGYVWSLWNNNVALNQVATDWHVLSWSAKWLDDPAEKIMYMDQRGRRDIEDDARILKGIWKLLNQADVVITHNGKKFDIKKLNARFIQHGFKPPSGFKHIDTYVIAKKKFGFTSNKLEYLADKLCVKYHKKQHKKYPGFELWRQCLAGNLEAWEEMRTYNEHDVLVLEELYRRMIPWDAGVNFQLYTDDETGECHNCGGETQRRGFSYTLVGKFQRYQCMSCGAWSRGRENLFTDAKRKSLRVPV